MRILTMVLLFTTLLLGTSSVVRFVNQLNCADKLRVHRIKQDTSKMATHRLYLALEPSCSAHKNISKYFTKRREL